MSNVLRFGPRIARTLANGGVTTGAIGVYPAHPSTTENSLRDVSGAGNNTVAGAAFVGATHFASPAGVLTVDAASTDIAQRLPAFGYDFNAGDALLVANRINITTSLPASSKPIWGQGGNNSAAPGWALKCKSTGNLFLQLDHAGGSVYGSDTDASGPASDGKLTAAAWHHVVVAFWGHNVQAGTAYYGVWINGKYAYSATSAKSMTGLPASCTPVEAMRLGAFYRTSGPTVSCIGATQCAWHFYRAPASVAQSFAAIDALAKRLYRDPESPLSLTEWPMA